MAEFQDKFVTVNGLKLHYLDWGNPDKMPMVLLHGLTGNAHNWDDLVPHFCDQYHIIALDQRGRGDSDWAPDGAYRVEDYASDMMGLANELGLGRFVLIGVSMGGRNALLYTSSQWRRVHKLVVVDIAPDIDPKGAARISGYVGGAPEEFADLDEVVAWAKSNYTFLTEEALLRRMFYSVKELPNGKLGWKYDKAVRQQRRDGTQPAAPDLWYLIGRIKAPTLLVRGAQSDILSKETARKMEAVMLDCRLVEVPGVGHAPTLEEPEALEAVKAFFTD